MERLKSLLQSLPAATVAHPWTAHLLMAAVLAGGWFCGSGLRTSLLPEQEPDRVTVELSWPGALPEEIEREAVVPLEAPRYRTLLSLLKGKALPPTDRAFSYILFQRFAQMFVYTGSMPAAVALWIPNMLFALITVFLYTKAQK